MAKLEATEATVEVPVEYLTALRRAVALQIDPETAEVCWEYAQMEDPYGDGICIPEECQQVGREYFALGSGVWVWFGDLPQSTCDALWEKHKSKLAFPAGLFDRVAGRAKRLKKTLEGYWRSLSSAAAVNFWIESHGTEERTIWCVRSSLVRGLPGPLLTPASTSNAEAL